MSATAALIQPNAAEQDFVEQVIAKHRGRPGALLSILEEVQDRHPNKYLSREVLDYIASRTGIPPSRIYSVVTFYALFNLEPQGQHTICICRGTACHTRGSRNLLERLQLELGVKNHDAEPGAEKVSVTTRDAKYTLRTVACFGQCALAPVVEVNKSIYGHMNERTLLREIEALE